jgi:hypothetical protein
VTRPAPQDDALERAPVVAPATVSTTRMYRLYPMYPTCWVALPPPPLVAAVNAPIMSVVATALNVELSSLSCSDGVCVPSVTVPNCTTAVASSKPWRSTPVPFAVAVFAEATCVIAGLM